MKYKRGYTLMELVIYVGLLALMFTATSTSAIAVYRIFGVTRIERTSTLQGDTALETIIRDIRTASSTNVVGSVFNISPGVLELGHVRFSLSGSTLKRTPFGGLPQNLTSGIRVSNLVFYYATTSIDSAESALISVRLTIEAGEGFFKQSTDFFGSAVVRGTY